MYIAILYIWDVIMSNSKQSIKIEGSAIRAKLRSAGLPGGGEKICCGGRRVFSRDYKTQLKKLNMRGSFQVFERGILMDTVTV